MARADTSMISRLKAAVTATIAPEANKGLITPCVKEPERIRIEKRADEGLLTPCVKQAVGVRIELAADDSFLTPCVKEADTFMIAAQRGVFVLGTQARANGEILINNPASDRPYWDQNSRDTYDPAPEVVVSGRPLLYSGDFFLIA